MVHSIHHLMTSLLARGKCTSLQRTQHSALMALAVAVALCTITVMNCAETHWLLAVFTPPARPQHTPLEQRFRALLKLWRREASPLGTLVPSRVSIMPRIRGKSRRGAAWYMVESRRQRQRKFERALAIASTRRRRRPRMPPMAYVEEITWEEAMQSHPTIEFGKEDKPPPGVTPQNFNANSSEDFFPTCFMEEETPLDATIGTVTLPEHLTKEATVIALFSTLETHGGPTDVVMLRHTLLPWISYILREVTPCMPSKV
jgi:hypothetical protein